MSDNRILSQKEAAFALAALMEIPSQYRVTQRLNLSCHESQGGPRTRPLPPPRDVINHDNAVKKIPPMTNFPKVEPSAPSLPVANEESVCPICWTNPKDMAFQCGHLTCKDCGMSLSSCPLCRQPISTRIRLQLSYPSFSNIKRVMVKVLLIEILVPDISLFKFADFSSMVGHAALEV